RVQITTDGLHSYIDPIGRSFREAGVDYAQLMRREPGETVRTSSASTEPSARLRRWLRASKPSSGRWRTFSTPWRIGRCRFEEDGATTIADKGCKGLTGVG